MNLEGCAGKVGSVLVAVTLAALPNVSSAIVLHQSGYTATLVMDLPGGSIHRDLAVDQSGDIYVATSTSGIQKISGTTITPWSSASVVDLALLPSGSGFGTGSPCDCILAIQADGSFSTLHDDTYSWSYVAPSSSGGLYASVTSIEGQGLYQIDPSTGNPTIVITGGPAPGGNGVYKGMAAGSDGTLFTLGSLDGTLSGNRLFRLDGKQLTTIATLPNGSGRLALGPAGTFYVTTAFTNGAGFPAGELWVVDPVLGSSSLLASNGSYPGLAHPTFAGVAFNPLNGTIYVLEGYKLWAITSDSTPAKDKSWGAVKAWYRGRSK